MPLPLLVTALGLGDNELHERLRQLRYRSTILVYLQTVTPVLPYLWVYANDCAYLGRITDFSAWRPQRAAANIVALEYWCSESDEIWTLDDAQLANRATAELSSVLARPVTVLNWQILRIKKSHPLHYRGYQQDVAAVTQHLRDLRGLSTIGRAGSYRYDSLASALEDGMATARLITTALR